jgi:hypothetical protein
MLSVAQIMQVPRSVERYGCLLNNELGKNLKLKESLPNLITIPAFAWRD